MIFEEHVLGPVQTLCLGDIYPQESMRCPETGRTQSSSFSRPSHTPEGKDTIQLSPLQNECTSEEGQEGVNTMEMWGWRPAVQMCPHVDIRAGTL